MHAGCFYEHGDDRKWLKQNQSFSCVCFQNTINRILAGWDSYWIEVEVCKGEQLSKMDEHGYMIRG